MDWSVLESDEVTEEFLEEYGWQRLYREVYDLERLEVSLQHGRSESSSMARDVEGRLSDAMTGLERAGGTLRALPPETCKVLERVEKTDGNEAIVSAAMILRRGDPSWQALVEDLGTRGGRSVLDQVLSVDHAKFTPGMFHRVQRLSVSEHFKAAVSENECEAMRLLGQWVLACQLYMDVQKQVAPTQDRLRGTEETLPAQEKQYTEVHITLVQHFLPRKLGREIHTRRVSPLGLVGQA